LVHRTEFDSITIAQARRKGGAKWSRYNEDVLPSFVADTDFNLPPAIHEAFALQLERQDYGYSLQMSERDLPGIYVDWAKRRFGWQVNEASIEALVDIVQGIFLCIQQYTQPGDGIATLTPTYPPLWSAIGNTGRRLIASTLTTRNGNYEIDFDDLRHQIDSSTKMFILCNPHNPTGRVFTRAELDEIAEIVVENNLLVLSDEIHADLVFSGHKHIPFASLSPEISSRTITLTSATKSFNLGGLRFAIAIFGSQQLQDQFNLVHRGMIGGLNSMGMTATEIAWRECGDWLDDMVGYLEGNRDYLIHELSTRVPQINCLTPESTFLAWLNCTGADLNEDPFSHFLNTAKVAFNPGTDFGPGGEGYVRLNYGTSRQILTEMIDRTVESISSLSDHHE
jgi:cystathionine beta-lyase